MPVFNRNINLAKVSPADSHQLLEIFSSYQKYAGDHFVCHIQICPRLPFIQIKMKDFLL